jgi:hypothetical protein
LKAPKMWLLEKCARDRVSKLITVERSDNVRGVSRSFSEE